MTSTQIVACAKEGSREHLHSGKKDNSDDFCIQLEKNYRGVLGVCNCLSCNHTHTHKSIYEVNLIQQLFSRNAQ